MIRILRWYRQPREQRREREANVLRILEGFPPQLQVRPEDLLLRAAAADALLAAQMDSELRPYGRHALVGDDRGPLPMGRLCGYVGRHRRVEPFEVRRRLVAGWVA